MRPSLLRQAGRQLLHLWLPGRHVRLEANTASAEDEERSHIYHVLSWIDHYDDQERLVLDVLLLLNASESSGDQLGAVRGLSGTGLICDLLPAFGLAERYHRRAVELAERLQHPRPWARPGCSWPTTTTTRRSGRRPWSSTVSQPGSCCRPGTAGAGGPAPRALPG